MLQGKWLCGVCEAALAARRMQTVASSSTACEQSLSGLECWDDILFNMLVHSECTQCSVLSG
jgi:hypothetical protein